MKRAVGVLATLLAVSAAADRVKPGAVIEWHDQARALVKDGRRMRDQGAEREGTAALTRARDLLRDATRKDRTFERAWVLLGEVQLDLRDNRSGARELAAAREVLPSSIPVKHLLGVHLFQLGKHRHAERILEEVAATGKARFDVYFLLCSHYYRTKRLNKALKHAAAYLRQRPKDVKVIGLVGNIHVRSGRLADAARSFREVLALDPGNLPVRVNLGNVFYQLERFEDAAHVYEAVVRTDPDLALVRFNLGSSYLKLERWTDALKHFDRFVALEPNQARGYFFAGRALARLGRVSDAIDRFTRATSLDATDPWAPFHVAELAAGRRDLSTARVFIQTALARQASHTRIRLLAGVVARKSARYSEGVMHLEMAVGLAPRDAAIRAELGFARIRSGTLDAGVDDLEAARALSPQEPRVMAWLPVARTRRAVLRLRTGDLAGAQTDLNRALEVDPRQSTAAWNLALLHDLNGNPRAGLRVAHTALAHRKNDPNLALAMSWLLVRLGEYSTAQATLKRAGGAADIGMRWLVQGALHGHFGENAAAVAAFQQAGANGVEPGDALHVARLDVAAGQLKKGRIQHALASLVALRSRLSPQLERVRAGLEVAALLARGTDLKPVGQLMAVLTSGPVERGWGLRGLVSDAGLIAGYVAFQSGELVTAEAALSAWSEDNPSETRARQLMAVVLTRLAGRDHGARRFVRASSLMARAVALTDDPTVHHNAAVVRYSRGDHPGAAKQFRRLAATGAVVTATLNLGLYLDDIVGVGGEAAREYRRYLAAGGRVGAEIARRRLSRKERILGP